MPLWIKIRKWSSLTFIRTQIMGKIRQFFVKLLDIRPRDKKDYYSIARWLVSRRLAFLLVVVLALGAIVYITATLPENFLKGNADGSDTRTYKYRALPLKFYSGHVKILARTGYVAYDGMVDGGAANGRGILYDPEGNVVYEGEFAENMYNGNGTYFYPTGVPQYVGVFVNNVYNGEGAYYRPNGVLEYTGNFQNGQRSGEGTLCNSVGDPVFNGNFRNGEIVYSDFLARPATEVAELYSGDTEVYQSEREFCVNMPEISAVYEAKDGSTTLENEWTVEKIYVLSDTIQLETGICTNVRELTEQLGTPLYYGTTWINLPEAVAWNELAEKMPDLVQSVEINAESSLESVYDVSDYDREFQVYLYTFEKEGLLYTFYFNGAGESEFLMYAVEKA